MALKASRAPGEGSAVASRSTAWRAAYFESRIVTSYSDTKATTATTVTNVLRQNEVEMITGACQKFTGNRRARQARFRDLNIEIAAVTPRGAAARQHAARSGFLVVDHFVNAPPARHEAERERIRDRRGDERAERRADRVGPDERSEHTDQLVPELLVEERQLEERRQLRAEARAGCGAASSSRPTIVANA